MLWHTTLLPRYSVYSSSSPRRSYSFSLSQSSRRITRSMFWVSLTLDTPNNVFTSMIPIPRSSIKCFVISGAEPTRVSSDTLRISTASSVTKRWPLLISSSAASDLPIPLSPVIRTPSPKTSTRTPCTEIQGASITLSQRIISAIKEEVAFFVEKSGILCSSAICKNKGFG